MNIDWTIWRPVLAGHDTLVNVKYAWTIDDLFDAHEALDIQEEARKHEEKRQ